MSAQATLAAVPAMATETAATAAHIMTNKGAVPLVASFEIGRPLKEIAKDGAAFGFGAGSVVGIGYLLYKHLLRPMFVSAIDKTQAK